MGYDLSSSSVVFSSSTCCSSAAIRFKYISRFLFNFLRYSSSEIGAIPTIFIATCKNDPESSWAARWGIGVTISTAERFSSCNREINRSRATLSSLYPNCMRVQNAPAINIPETAARRPDKSPRSKPPVMPPLTPLSSNLFVRRFGTEWPDDIEPSSELSIPSSRLL